MGGYYGIGIRMIRKQRPRLMMRQFERYNDSIEANQSRKLSKGLLQRRLFVRGLLGCYHLNAGLKHCDFADYVNALPGGLLEGRTPHELEY